MAQYLVQTKTGGRDALQMYRSVERHISLSRSSREVAFTRYVITGLQVPSGATPVGIYGWFKMI